jgi:hypothetical protein
MEGVEILSFRSGLFLNLLPSSEGDKEKFVADQPLEVSLSGSIATLQGLIT